MTIFHWVETKIPKLRWYDISLIKLSTAAIVLMLAKFWPPLLSLDWSVYLIIGLAAGVPVIYKMFCNK